MTENQLERNKRLLALKGVVVEEEEPEPVVDAGLILEQYEERKQRRQDTLEELDQLEIDILKLLKKKMEKAT